VSDGGEVVLADASRKGNQVQQAVGQVLRSLWCGVDIHRCFCWFSYCLFYGVDL